MTTPHRTLQMALDALDAITDDVDGTGLNTMPSFDKAIDAITALREALAAPMPEPAAWKHDCAALCTNDVELWIDACPHCGKPRTAPPAAPADDHATPSGGQEAGPQEDRIEAAYWRFDARHKGYSQWKTAPMSERDAFKAEMRNALEAEKVRAEMRLVARGWRRPDAPAAPASQWMPIDTAPKDGTLFLCWVAAVRCGETDEGRQYEEDVSQLDFCYWRTQSDTPDGGWFDPCCGQIGDQQRVTHWMPLPAAPDHLRDVAEKVAPAAPVVREPRHVRKVGGSFQHTGAVVAEFKTTAGEPRIVLEFDAPVAGMLHVYRPDQVEDTTGGKP